MLLREKIDAWYERHSGLTALIFLAVFATVLACVPGDMRKLALKWRRVRVLRNVNASVVEATQA